MKTKREERHNETHFPLNFHNGSPSPSGEVLAGPDNLWAWCTEMTSVIIMCLISVFLWLFFFFKPYLLIINCMPGTVVAFGELTVWAQLSPLQLASCVSRTLATVTTPCLLRFFFFSFFKQDFWKIFICNNFLLADFSKLSLNCSVSFSN